VAELAAKQHGVIGAWQLEELGWDREALRRQVAKGFLHRIHHGVYAVGHPEATPNGVLMAALLACGPGAVLSHRSAAAVWDLRQASTPIPDVSVPRSRERRPGVRMHRPRKLEPQDVTVHNGFPVTTVTRTLVDMAGTTTPQRLNTMFEAAIRRGLLDTKRAADLCSGRRGAKNLMRLLAQATEPDRTRSELERLFRRGCEKHGLPLPSFNAWLLSQEVDALWGHERVVVELDSWEYHRTRAAFERDRARDAALVAAGYRPLRFTWRQLRGDIAWRRLAQALAAPPVNRIAPACSGGQTTPLAKRRP
jgi:very-short-patch-repair endonuclease